MNTITKIYLVTNIDNDPNKVYVGKTYTDDRINQHKQRFGDQINFSYIDEIEGLDKNSWKPLERYWIEQFRQWGFILVNKNKGGGGPNAGVMHSKEWVDKIVQALKNKTLPIFNCKFCNKELGGKGNLNKHQNTCKNNPDKQEPKPKSEKWLQAIKKPRNKINYKKSEEWKQSHSKTMKDLFKNKAK
jgi:hypothetical protein